MQIVWKGSRREGKKTIGWATKCLEESLNWHQMSGRVFELAPGSQMSGRVIEIENLQSHRKEKLHLSHVSLFTGTWHQSLWHLVV